MATVEISTEMRQRFERCAPGALKRRTPAYLNGVAFNSVRMPVLGGIGLAGLYLWNWSPLTLFLLMIAGLVAEILVCTLRWLVARSELQRQVDRHNDDRFVWAVASALKEGKTEVDAGNFSEYRASVGVFIDWLCGAVALLLLAYALMRMGVRSPAQLFAGGELRWAILAALALPLVEALMSIRSWRDTECAAVEGFAAGLYGAMALVFCAIFAIGIDSMEALRKLMVGINWALVGLGALALLGYWIMRSEANWLREHLHAASRPPA